MMFALHPLSDWRIRHALQGTNLVISSNLSRLMLSFLRQKSKSKQVV